MITSSVHDSGTVEDIHISTDGPLGGLGPAAIRLYLVAGGEEIAEERLPRRPLPRRPLRAATVAA